MGERTLSRVKEKERNINPNALRISDHIEKVEVDFSSYGSLKESIGFRRLYTIHTVQTLEYSQKLGFHVGGFCDDHGRGGEDYAACIAGYENLPFDLIVCRMDDKYDYLPCTPSELDALYILLTQGKTM